MCLCNVCLGFAIGVTTVSLGLCCLCVDGLFVGWISQLVDIRADKVHFASASAP